MQVSRADLIARIDSLTQTLVKPPTRRESRAGWVPATRTAIVTWLIDTRLRLLDESDVLDPNDQPSFVWGTQRPRCLGSRRLIGRPDHSRTPFARRRPTQVRPDRGAKSWRAEHLNLRADRWPGFWSGPVARQRQARGAWSAFWSAFRPVTGHNVTSRTNPVSAQRCGIRACRDMSLR